MSNAYALAAKSRSLVGKGASRRLRREEKALPAIVYGAGKEPTQVSIITKDFIKQLENEAFFAHIIDINIEGASEQVVLKDVQRHPVSNWPIHADFLRIDQTHKIQMKIPLHFTNEDECVGIKENGGIANHLMNDLEILCFAKDLPEYIEVDVGALDVGDSLHLSDIKLPAGVEAIALIHGDDEHDLTVVTIALPRAAAASESEEDEDDAPEAPPAPDASKQNDD